MGKPLVLQAQLESRLPKLLVKVNPADAQGFLSRNPSQVRVVKSSAQASGRVAMVHVSRSVPVGALALSLWLSEILDVDNGDKLELQLTSAVITGLAVSTTGANQEEIRKIPSSQEEVLPSSTPTSNVQFEPNLAKANGRMCQRCSELEQELWEVSSKLNDGQPYIEELLRQLDDSKKVREVLQKSEEELQGIVHTLRGALKKSEEELRRSQLENEKLSEELDHKATALKRMESQDEKVVAGQVKENQKLIVEFHNKVAELKRMESEMKRHEEVATSHFEENQKLTAKLHDKVFELIKMESQEEKARADHLKENQRFTAELHDKAIELKRMEAEHDKIVAGHLEENQRLTAELHDKVFDLKKIEAQQEKVATSHFDENQKLSAKLHDKAFELKRMESQEEKVRADHLKEDQRFIAELHDKAIELKRMEAEHEITVAGHLKDNQKLTAELHDATIELKRENLNRRTSGAGHFEVNQALSEELDEKVLELKRMDQRLSKAQQVTEHVSAELHDKLLVLQRLESQEEKAAVAHLEENRKYTAELDDKVFEIKRMDQQLSKEKKEHDSVVAGHLQEKQKLSAELHAKVLELEKMESKEEKVLATLSEVNDDRDFKLKRISSELDDKDFELKRMDQQLSKQRKEHESIVAGHLQENQKLSAELNVKVLELRKMESREKSMVAGHLKESQKLSEELHGKLSELKRIESQKQKAVADHLQENENVTAELHSESVELKILEAEYERSVNEHAEFVKNLGKSDENKLAKQLLEKTSELKKLEFQHSKSTETQQKLTAELHGKTFEVRRMESQQEKVVNDYAKFVQCIAASSSSSMLGNTFDLKSAELLGMGNYGYVMICKSLKDGQRLVVKLQSQRWVAVAVQEWAHGSDLGSHPNMVRYVEASMHRDDKKEMANLLQKGFDSGSLTGKRPRCFPDVFFCMTLEYMNCGTVQTFMDKGLLSAEGTAAVSRQVASALAFIHQKKQTHNDIKPENILLADVPGKDHLRVKLADLGLAEHSIDRKRDCDLFAYTVWCMGLGEKFGKCPDGKDRDAATARLQKQVGIKLPVLVAVVSGLWVGDLEPAEVASLEQLKGCEVRAQQSKQLTAELELAAKKDVRRRSLLTEQEAIGFVQRMSVTAIPDLSALEIVNDGNESEEPESEGDGEDS